jgi:chorismate mutase
MVEANNIGTADIASAIFTVTSDLKSAFPAQAARQLGWTDVPLLCAQEIDVTNRLDRCIRILLHWNTDKSANEIIHIYINGAKVLRPDWVARLATQNKQER